MAPPATVLGTRATLVHYARLSDEVVPITRDDAVRARDIVLASPRRIP